MAILKFVLLRDDLTVDLSDRDDYQTPLLEPWKLLPDTELPGEKGIVEQHKIKVDDPRVVQILARMLEVEPHEDAQRALALVFAHGYQAGRDF